MKARFPDLDEPLQPSERNIDPTDDLPPCVVLMATDDDQDAHKHAALRIKGLLGLSIDRGPEGKDAPILEPGDLAILVRTNDEVTTWVEALSAQGIPARSDGGTPLLRRPEVVAMYRFLQLLARYPDDVALVEALATPHFEGVDLSDEEARILSYGLLRGTPLTDRLKERYPGHHHRLEELRTYALAATVPQLLGRIEEAFDLKDYYRLAGDEAAALALDRLRDYARSRFDSDQALTLRTFLEMLRRDIMNDTDLPEPASAEQGRAPHVKVMTIHRAKGSEFPVVVIPNLEAKRSPQRPPDFILDTEHGLEVNLYRWRIQTASDSFWVHVRREEERSIAEEMRLFYVAITRAERMLLLLGRDLPPPGPERPVHRWQTSVLDAEYVLEQCGALFGPLVRVSST